MSIVCALQTSRRGRVRYPPLAFWMQETKVHDKHGGAVAIQRAAPSPATLAHPKPPLHAGPAPLARAPSRAQAGAQARQPAASVTHSQAKTKSEPQAEMQSHQQTGAGLSDMDDTVGGAAAKQGQRSSKRTATSPEPALTVLPRDPPSPPFPYPILAKRAPPPSRGAPALASVKQAAQKHTLPAQSQLPADTPAAADGMAVASKKPTSKGKARRWAGASACADQAGAAVNAHRHSGNEAQAEAELSSSAAHAAVGSKAMDKAGGPANTASPKVKPKRCGSCKNCLRAKSAKQGCLVLRAAREHAHSALAAHQEPGPEPTKPTAKPTAVSVAKAKPTAAAGATAAATKPKQATLAKPGQSLAVQEGGVEAGVKPNKGCKADKAKASKAKGSKADRQARSISNDSVSKRGKACSCPQGSIHSALTQAVELASDMEQPGAVQQQQEAAEALESLKHSPVGPAPVHPAPSGLPLPTSSGQTAAGGSPEASQGGAAAAGASPAKRGRGRPRKERKPGEEIPLASVGPKRGRGRPPKSPPQPAVVDAGQAAGSAAGLPGDAAGGQPGSTAASPLPLKVTNPRPFAPVLQNLSCFKHAP